MHEQGWITFYNAADKIRKHFNCGWAEAKSRLRSACGDAKIDTMKALYDPEQLPREFWTGIAPGVWREREVDHDGPDADGCVVMVMVNEDDFNRWLASQPQLDDPSPRDAAIRKRLTAGQHPPHTISWKEFCNGVRHDAGGDQPAHGFSNKQIERIAKVIGGWTSKTS